MGSGPLQPKLRSHHLPNFRWKPPMATIYDSSISYDLHPSVAHVQAMLANLKARTGLDLGAWVARVKAEGPAEEKARRAWFKAQGLGGNQALFLAERSMGSSGHAFDDTPQGYLAAAPDYVSQHYTGKKAAFVPLYGQLVGLVRTLGPDVRICPCQTMVPFYRQHVFAEVKPLASRLDLGLALGDPASVTDPSGRLRETGGFARKDRLTHKLEVRTTADLEDALAWLKVAYERDRPV
jgi:Domain of unknown function (DUF5655)